jgi:hypothetical protein
MEPGLEPGMTNSSLIELMAPSKRPTRPTGYEDRFASDALMQPLDSAHNEDGGFLQYVHFSTTERPLPAEVMALYATPGTIESAFHRRHAEHSPGADHLNGELSGIISHIAGSCLPIKSLIPANPQIISGSPFEKKLIQKEQQGKDAQLHQVGGGSPLKQPPKDGKQQPHMTATSSEECIRRSYATPVILPRHMHKHTYIHTPLTLCTA